MTIQKKIVIALIMLLPVAAFSFSKIHDNYTETNFLNIHSEGLFSYGLHSNTFHLRNYYLRMNIQTNALQFFTTIYGYMDTHNPEIDYPYIMNNIQMYDYGVQLSVMEQFNLSFRGAATYQLNTESLVLMSPYYKAGNPAEFDTPAQYIPGFLTAPGIRIAYQNPIIEAGYSQGDYRHMIPSSLMLKAGNDNLYFRAVMEFDHTDPKVFVRDSYYILSQISTGGKLSIFDWTLRGLADVTWDNNYAQWYRGEESFEYAGFTGYRLAFRELYKAGSPVLLEASIEKNYYDMVSVGFQAANDGRMYIISKVNF